MTTIPEHVLAGRRELGARYLAGQGVEIGALHYPMSVASGARVTYVDRYPVETLRRHYPELDAHALVPVDAVDDGEVLGTFPDASLDFVIANHMLEHAENPLGAIRQHLRKVRPSGILYYAIPDRRFSCDRDRALTSFRHLVIDDRVGTWVSRRRHFREWVHLVDRERDPDRAERRVRELLEMRYSIHFHVWDTRAFLELLVRASRYLGGGFSVEHFGRNDTEAIAVLRRE